MLANSLNAPPAAASAQYVDPLSLSGQSLASEQVPAPVHCDEFRGGGAEAMAGRSATVLQSYSVEESSDHLMTNDDVVTECISEAVSQMQHSSPLLAAGRTVHRRHFDLHSVLITIIVLLSQCSHPIFAVTRAFSALPRRPASLVKEANTGCSSGKWMNADGNCLDCSVVQTFYQEQLCPCEANRDAVITCKRGIDPRVMDCQQYDNGVEECRDRQELVEHTAMTTLSPMSDSVKAAMETPFRTTTPSDPTGNFTTTDVVLAVCLVAAGVVVITVVTIYCLRRRKKIPSEVIRYAILPQTKDDCVTPDYELSQWCASLSAEELNVSAAYVAPPSPLLPAAAAGLAVAVEVAVTSDGNVTAQTATVTEMTIAQVEAEAAATEEIATAEFETAMPAMATTALEAVTAATAKAVVWAVTATLAEPTPSYWTSSRLRQPAVT